jgi:hypothetical protein
MPAVERRAFRVCPMPHFPWFFALLCTVRCGRFLREYQRIRSVSNAPDVPSAPATPKRPSAARSRRLLR